MKISLVFLKQLLFRNAYCRLGKRAQKRKVNLECFNSEVNLGDMLSPVIYKWMLDKASIPYDKKIRRTRHLMTLGSILGGNGFFDATVWGSGIKSFDQIAALSKRRYFQKLDIRCVRGPLTRDALQGCGYKCSECFGDPAVLMPLIYNPKIEKKHKVGTIPHFTQTFSSMPNVKNLKIRTNNYKQFIDELLSCEKIVSSSLHGIILAEAYGIPAVFLGVDREREMIKYYDWYYSTGRKSVKIASTLEEAIAMSPMATPDLSLMQEDLIKTFPYDLWEI